MKPQELLFWMVVGVLVAVLILLFSNQIIKNHLSQTTADNVIFILVATPVAEVGRDHDFDWAVVEPSSFRSIIQLAGRVLRHRDREVENPNIALMQYNLRALKGGGENLAFRYPGYETEKKYKLNTYDICKLIEKKSLQERVRRL